MRTFDLQGAAEFLRVSKDSMRDMADSGKVPAAKIGPTSGYRWVFTDESLEEYLRQEVSRQTAERRKEGDGYAITANKIPQSARKAHRRKAAAPPPITKDFQPNY